MNMELTAARTRIDELANQNIRATEGITSLRNQHLDNATGSQNGLGSFSMPWSGPPLPNYPRPPFLGVASQPMLAMPPTMSILTMPMPTFHHNVDATDSSQRNDFQNSRSDRAHRSVQAIDVYRVDPTSISEVSVNATSRPQLWLTKCGLDESYGLYTNLTKYPPENFEDVRARTLAYMRVEDDAAFRRKHSNNKKPLSVKKPEFKTKTTSKSESSRQISNVRFDK
ncbi:hypothetical protein L6452_08754 [Arctium lappa]|uniref:Uncharacterized protein n=1 Tax=Arctium lappa TaxID=4217 RepID=A0ACB9DIK6_ARCLA|nr:hypothetical protein L6452_08754 [Arctium lappa]